MKRWLLLLLAAMMITTIVAGCSGNESANSSSGKSEGSSNSGGEKNESPLDLTLMLPIFKTNYPKDGSPVAAELEKKTNTKIHFEWVPNASYADKFNITLASGKLPSIIYVGDVKASGFVNAAKSGAFWEVGPYLKDYPNLSQANPVILKNSAMEGEKYGGNFGGGDWARGLPI